MFDGAMARRSDQEELMARHTAFLANTTGFGSKRSIQMEDVLGRPLRRAWKEAMQKKNADPDASDDTDVTVRIAEKDRARAKLRSKQGKT